MSEQTIPCPVCENQISFNVKELLSGVQFTCSNCNAQIGLPNESKPIVPKTIKGISGSISNKK